jgi:hypothetical protein
MVYLMGKILQTIAQKRASFVPTLQLQVHHKMEPCIRKQNPCKTKPSYRHAYKSPMLSLPTPSTLPPSQPIGVEDEAQQISGQWLKWVA